VPTAASGRCASALAALSAAHAIQALALEHDMISALARFVEALDCTHPPGRCEHPIAAHAAR
jgi:hypothetical protein